MSLSSRLLACHPCVSLMEAPTEIRNEDIRLCNAGLFQSSSKLATRSSSSLAAAPSVAGGRLVLAGPLSVLLALVL